MISEKLEKFGLSEKESKVYLSLLQLGTSVVSDVAKKAQINRSTTYVLLESLVRHELASISERKNIRLYTPAPPERIIQILEESVKKYIGLVEIAKTILPELKSTYVDVGPKSKVKFLEGVEGIKTAYENTLTSKETIRAFASIENMHTAIPDYFPEYYNRRSAKNIHIKAIFPDTPEAQERIKFNEKEAREAYLVPSEHYGFSPEINIYDDKIVFMSLMEKFALMIESAELANALKKAFDLAWMEAERLHKRSHG